MFDRLVGALPDKPTLDDGKAIARFVNIATGRGDLGKLSSAADALGAILWSPRLLASRFQTLLPTHALKGSKRTNFLVAKEYARFLAGAAALYTAVQMYDDLDGEEDVDVTFDPRSSDFGKLKVGKTRIDVLGGMSQVAVFAARLLSGEKKTLSGKTQKIRGDVKYGQEDAVDVAKNFIRTKLNPVAGAIVDIASGKNLRGEKVTAGSTATGLTLPLSIRDVKANMKDLGVPGGIASTLLSLFGVGVQTYDK